MAKQKKTSVGKTILISIVSIILGILIGFVAGSVFAPTDLDFYLVGDDTVSVAIGNKYTEEGFVCTYRGKDYSDAVVISYSTSDLYECSHISTDAVETYFVTYSIINEKFSSKLTRVVNVVEYDDLEINFMTLGNAFSGDSIYIKAGETDILVDAGSREESATAIKDYIFDSESDLHSYVSDNKLEYVIATHADQDHIAAFVGSKGILTDNNIEIDNIITFAKSNKTTKVYNNFKNAVEARKASGTKVYTALDCYNNVNGASRIIQVAAGIEIEILYNYFYDHDCPDNENNYSVCFMLRRGEEQYLFTGDLENEDGNAEDKLVENNDLGEVYLYKMGHHGSKTSSSMNLLNEIKPKVVVATCVAFSTEYTKNMDNTFPTKIAVDNINSLGTVEHFYVTSMVKNNEAGFEDANGNIVVKANSNGTYVECSNSNEDFYNFDIFKQYRSWTTN